MSEKEQQLEVQLAKATALLVRGMELVNAQSAIIEGQAELITQLQSREALWAAAQQQGRRFDA